MNFLELVNIGVSSRHSMDVEIIPLEADSVSNGVYMFGVNYSAEIQEPGSNYDSVLRLEVADASSDELHQISIFLENLSMENQGLLACVISMQTGTSISKNELERLRRKEYFDYFEVRKHGSEIVVYWRGIEGAGKKEFKIWYKEDFEVQNPNPILVEAFLCYDRRGSKVSKMLPFL